MAVREDPVISEKRAREKAPAWFAERTGFLLSKAGREMVALFTRVLEPLGLRPKHFGTLTILAVLDGCSQQELADRSGIDPSAVVAVVDDLERAGLVERGHDPADRRRHSIHLTEAGRTKLAEARVAGNGAEDEILAPLDANEREQLRRLLLRIVEARDPQIRPSVPGPGED